MSPFSSEPWYSAEVHQIEDEVHVLQSFGDLLHHLFVELLFRTMKARGVQEDHLGFILWSRCPRTCLRVVWGVGETMETLKSRRVLRRVDLPEEGRPTRRAKPDFTDWFLLNTDFLSH
jgi:hypothetical protein